MKHSSYLRLLAAAIPLLLGVAFRHSVVASPRTEPSARPGAAGRAEQSSTKQAPQPARGGQEIVAVVDGIPITKLEWDRLADPYFAEIEARAGRKLTDDEQGLLRRNVLQELVRERLWVADAKRRGFTTTEAELDARLQRNVYFKTNGKFDPVKFREFKFSPASNYRELLGQIQNAVLLDKYVAWMKTRYAVPESELRKEFMKRTAQASIRFLWLTPDAVSLGLQATAEQIRAYYDGHPDEFKSPEEARITYVRVPIVTTGLTSDTLRAIAHAQAAGSARALLASLKSGKPADAAAKKFGGVKDSGLFRVGEPILGLGRSDALTDAIRAARPKQWLPEPIAVGPHYVVARLEEHREPAPRPFREVVALAKRRADGLLRDAELDSLGRLDYAARPDRYRVELLHASIIARATDSFSESRPVSDRDVAKTLERIRKSSGMPDTARAWSDSVLKTLPDLVRKENQLNLAFKTMAAAAARLERGDRAEEVARRFDATLDQATIYEGQPPERPSLVEGGLLDSLYKKSPGTVAGPRVLRDSVFVVRVTDVDAKFLPTYEAVRGIARSEVELRRRAETEKDARAYFESHRDRYETPQRWVFDYVVFRKSKPDSAPIPQDSIRTYYDRHPLEFTVPARAHARHILVAYRPGDGPGARGTARKKALDLLKRVKDGEDFAAIAKENSDDRGSAANGGDLGEITRGEVVKEFGDALFALKPGQTSEVIESKYGFHIIRLEGMTPQRLRTLEECRAEIHGVLGESVSDSLARTQAAAFSAAASRPEARFEDLAKPYGGASTSGPLARLEPVPGLGQLPTMESDIGSLPEGGISRPIAVQPGYLVARLTRSVAPHPAAFTEVKEAVNRDMQIERRRMLADSIDAALARGLQARKDLETLALPLGGLKISRFFPRHGPIPDLARDSLLTRDSTLYDEIFSSRPGSVLKRRPGSLGTLYAVVDSLIAASPTQYAEHRNELKQELFEQRSAAWTDRLRARGKIQLYRKDLKLE